MKIAFFLPSLANKGPVLVVKDLVTFLKDKAEVIVYYFDPIVETTFNCPTVRIKFFDKIDLSQYDILHSHMLRPDAFLYFNRKKIKGKCISTLHNYVEEDLSNSHNSFTSFIFTKVWNRLLSRHHMLVPLSQHMKEYYARIYSNKNLTYIYNGRNISHSESDTVTQEETDQILKFKNGSVLLGVSALLTQRKGIDQTIHLLERMPNLKLLIVGDGPAKSELQILASKIGVANRCLFLGYRKDGYRYNSFFDIYAMTSRSEGFPLAMIEAAAYGIPTLTSNLPIFEEAFNDTEVSFYKLDDIETMQVATENLISNRELFSRNILAKYNACYRAETMASNYLNLYKDLVQDEI